MESLILSNTMNLYGPLVYKSAEHNNYGMTSKGTVFQQDRYGYWSEVSMKRPSRTSKQFTTVRINGNTVSLAAVISETLNVSEAEARSLVEQLNAVESIITYKEVS